MSANESHLETLLVAALEIEDACQRDAFLQGACVGDASRLAQVQCLVHDYFAAGTLLDRPAGGIATVLVPQTKSDALGSQIGPYKLREVLGEGGMGTVFVAEQEKPVRRKVALKLIKLGMDSKEVLSRFEAERQALALMDHPNIARVLDAGMTDAGRPYFVMELVKGLPITEHCDLHKLGSRERLELFVQVCRAVQHAHQKGIIHRDLKPSNVLVAMHDTIPVVKVIDFGVAKAIGQPLTEKTLYTGLGQMVGTPMYMSPEQAGQSSIDVDTRSDVYSLGVLLYELLTGCTPFEKDTLKRAGFDELRRIIQEVEPPRPSTRFSTLNAVASSTIANCRQSDPHKLSQQLRGELDWIVMKALEKDRTHRYESASAFAADVEHFLCDEPVEACPPSAMYRFRKYARRRKFFLTAAFAICFSVLTGTGLSIWQAVEAIQARKLADKRLGRANERLTRETEARVEADKQRQQASTNLKLALEAVDQMLLRVADERLAAIPGAEPIRQELFQDALRFYENFFRQSPDDPQLQMSTAKAWSQVGNLHLFMGHPSKGQEARLEAIRRFEILLAKSPKDTDIQKSLAEVHYAFAGTEHWLLWKFASADSACQRAISLYRELIRQFPDNTEYAWDESNLEVILADNYKCIGQWDLAESTYEHAVDSQRQLWSKPASPKRKQLPASLVFFAHSLRDTGHRTNELESLYAEAFQRSEEFVASDSQATCAVGSLVLAAKAYGDYLYSQRKIAEAELHYRRAIDVGKLLPLVNPTDFHGNCDVPRANLALAELLAQNGRSLESLTYYREAGNLLSPVAILAENYGGLAGTYHKAVEGLLDNLEKSVSEGHLEEARRFCESLTVKNGPVSQIFRARFLAMEAWERVGDAERAEQLRVSLLGDVEQHLAAAADPEERVSISGIVFRLGDNEFRRSRDTKAMPFLDLVLRGDPKNAEALEFRGRMELDRGDYEKAIADFDACLASETANGFNTTLGCTACIGRANANLRLANHAEVLADLTRAAEYSPGNADLLNVIDPEQIKACPDQSFRDEYVSWFQRHFLVSKPVDAALIFRARLWIHLGMAEAAETDLAALANDASMASYRLYLAALTSLEGGNTTRYQQFCRLLVDRAKSDSSEYDCRWITWTNVLAPNSLDDYAPAVAAARRGVLLDPHSSEPQHNLGCILFRFEQFDDAVVHLASATNAVDANEVTKAYCSCFLAMTHHRLGHPDESKRWYDTATESAWKLLTLGPSAKTPPLLWNQKLTLQLLQAEATELLQISEPTAAERADQPATK